VRLTPISDRGRYRTRERLYGANRILFQVGYTLEPLFDVDFQAGWGLLESSTRTDFTRMLECSICFESFGDNLVEHQAQELYPVVAATPAAADMQTIRT
jgi:hypothetical protein